jgi:photosystem II stability/assembly factor-like uncharacterized protein
MFGGLSNGWGSALLAIAALVAALPCRAEPVNGFVDPLDAPAALVPAAAGAPIMAVVRTPSNRWVACGRRGVILLSDDGNNWHQARVPVSTDLVALSFPTAQHGWAVGHGGVILHTADGGSTWSRQLDGRQLPDMLIAHFKPLADHGDEAASQALADAQRLKEEGPGRPLLAIWFQDELRGLAVGAYNLALHTANGGRSWKVLGDRLDNPQGMHLYAIAAAGSTLWLAGEQGLLLKGSLPEEAGDVVQFTRVKTPYAGTFFGVVAQGSDVVAFGLRGNAVHSSDGGSSWSPLDTGTPSTITAAALMPGGALTMVGMSGELLVRRMGTARLQPQNTQRPMPLYAVAPMDAAHVVVAGARGVAVQGLPAAPADTNAR